jgi:hypothetical protein
MENKDISQIALEKIKESGIKPISKNIFNLKRVLFWSLVGFAVLVGAVSFAVTCSILFSNDWYLYNKFGFGFILKSLPYFWVICLLLLAILGEFYYRKTLFGYRHRVFTIIGVYIILTVVFGFVLHLFKIGEVVEQTISDNVPFYRGMMFNKDELWSQPEEGLISGRIVEVDDVSIKIIDLNDNVWIIDKNEAIIAPRVKMEIGEIIKIVGDKDSDNDEIFNANQIRPWMGSRGRQGCCTVR